jgi:hypothetical protein
MILAIIAVIIIAIYGMTIFWINGIVMLIGVFLAWLVLNDSCNSYAAQHLTEDTWCKN